MPSHVRRLALLCLAPLAGCGGPNAIVGDWASPTGSDDWTNELSILEDLTASMLMHYSMAGVAYHSEFDIEVEDRDGGLYWLDVACVEDCPESGMDDFRFTCQMSEDTRELECDGGGWSELVWERVD